MECSCERGNEPLVSITCGEFLDQMRTGQLLRKEGLCRMQLACLSAAVGEPYPKLYAHLKNEFKMFIWYFPLGCKHFRKPTESLRTVLHCSVLYCTVLHCTALHCTVLHCTVLHCTVLHCTALYCTVLHCTALYSSHIARTLSTT